MVLRSTLVLAALLIAPAADAQDDPMALQRCIRACLADASGPDDPAYQSCVAAKCATEAAAEAAPDTTQRWYSGAREMGRVFAAIDTPGHAGQSGILYICERGAPDRVVMRGFEGPAGRMLFIISDHFFPLHFEQAHGELHATAPEGLADALMAGEKVTVAAKNGKPFHSLTLDGSRAAFEQMRAGC